LSLLLLFRAPKGEDNFLNSISSDGFSAVFLASLEVKPFRKSLTISFLPDGGPGGGGGGGRPQTLSSSHLQLLDHPSASCAEATLQLL